MAVECRVAKWAEKERGDRQIGRVVEASSAVQLSSTAEERSMGPGRKKAARQSWQFA